MVYPITKFAYSFTQRLQELAVATEAYHLQLADVDQVVFKVPPKGLTYYKSIKFEMNPSTDQIIVETFKTQKEYVQNPGNPPTKSVFISDDQVPDLFTAKEVEIVGFPLPLFFTHPILKRFAFYPSNIRISDSAVDEGAIELLWSGSVIAFEESCNFSPGLSLFSIIKKCPSLFLVEFEFDVIDNNFLTDLDKVFSSSKTPLRVSVKCDYKDLKQKFNNYDLPCYFSNPLFEFFNVFNRARVDLNFFVPTATYDDAKSFLTPFTNRLVGHEVYFIECDPRGPMFSITNQAFCYLLGLRRHYYRFIMFCQSVLQRCKRFIFY